MGGAAPKRFSDIPLEEKLEAVVTWLEEHKAARVVSIDMAEQGSFAEALVIASATEEQAKVAHEVDRNLLNIRELSTRAADGAHQTSSASGELSRLASELSAMVRHFKT